MIYLDNAATTKVSEEVFAAIKPFFCEQYANPSAIYRFAGKSMKAVDEARHQTADLIGADAKEIYFTAGGSEADNWAIKAVAEAYQNKGKHIITSVIEHHAVLHTCQYLEKQGFEVTYIQVDEYGRVKLDELEQAIRPDTILISIMAANNEIGTIQPIQEIGALARKHGIPIYGTKETWKEIETMKYLGEYPKELFSPILPDTEFSIGDMKIEPFRIDHDAANPVAYRISNTYKSVAVVTDLGHFDQYIIEHLQNLDALLLESNHDVRMLETGPYPYYLKRRILSDHGHLSNDNAGRLLNYILNDHLKHIFLGHLSKENNYEELAYETVRLEISQGETPYEAGDFSIFVASRDRMSEILTI